MKDVKQELETALETLSGKGKGAKGKPPRGAERRKMWEEVKALRKEYVSYPGRAMLTLADACATDSGNGREVSSILC